MARPLIEMILYQGRIKDRLGRMELGSIAFLTSRSGSITSRLEIACVGGASGCHGKVDTKSSLSLPA